MLLDHLLWTAEEKNYFSNLIYYFIFCGTGKQFFNSCNHAEHICFFVNHHEYYIFSKSDFPKMYEILFPYLKFSIRGHTAKKKNFEINNV
jgi:hypothetical protein